MIANLIGGFVAILIGVSLVGPISTEVNSAAVTDGALYNICFGNFRNRNCCYI